MSQLTKASIRETKGGRYIVELVGYALTTHLGTVPSLVKARELLRQHGHETYDFWPWTYRPMKLRVVK